MKPTYTTQIVLRRILDDLKGCHLFADVFIIFSMLAGCSPKKKAPKSPWALQIRCRIFVATLKVREDLLYYIPPVDPFVRQKKTESLLNGHIWLIIKTHQTNLMAPWYPHTWIFDTKGMTTFFMIRTKGQNMLRCSGQNVNQKLGRTKCQPQKKVRTKCQPQKKVRTKCQPLVGISSGWHFVRLAFCPTTPSLQVYW